jgi:hypothetical protein
VQNAPPVTGYDEEAVENAMDAWSVPGAGTESGQYLTELLATLDQELIKGRSDDPPCAGKP